MIILKCLAGAHCLDDAETLVQTGGAFGLCHRRLDSLPLFSQQVSSKSLGGTQGIVIVVWPCPDRRPATRQTTTLRKHNDDDDVVRELLSRHRQGPGSTGCCCELFRVFMRFVDNPGVTSD